MTSQVRKACHEGLVAVLIALAGPAMASSKFVNVQGKLTDTSGNLLTGSQTITFRLYTSSTATVGTAFWTESQSLTLSTGLFNATLGNVTSLDATSFNQLYYLGIQVAGDANELAPRQQLGASPYAQGSLGDFNVGNNLIVGNSETVGGTTITASSATTPTLLVTNGLTAGSIAIGATSVTASSITVTLLGVSSITASGTLNVNGAITARGSALFQGSGSTVTIQGADASGVSLGVSGAISAPSSSVTASAFFGDGSHLASVMLPTSTDTISGAKTFVSSMTIGYNLQTTTITLSRGSIINGWTLVASTQIFGGVARIYFTGLQPDRVYHVYWSAQYNGAGGTSLRGRFNCDSTAAMHSSSYDGADLGNVDAMLLTPDLLSAAGWPYYGDGIITVIGNNTGMSRSGSNASIIGQSTYRRSDVGYARHTNFAGYYLNGIPTGICLYHNDGSNLYGTFWITMLNTATIP